MRAQRYGQEKSLLRRSCGVVASSSGVRRRVAIPRMSRPQASARDSAALSAVNEVRLDSPDMGALPAELLHRREPRILGQDDQEHVASNGLDSLDAESAIGIGKGLDCSGRDEGDDILARHSCLLRPGGRGCLWIARRTAVAIA